MKSTLSKNKLSPFIVSTVASLISFLRMYIGENNFVKNNLWAEDGLFTVCYLKSDFKSCLTDSYSGYLLVYPRVISYIVHFFSIDNWALINNILYLIVVFVTTYFVFILLRKEYYENIA
ncbi:MAG: hypothetical protein RIS18_62, partial [Actinomycetota bacterium]